MSQQYHGVSVLFESSATGKSSLRAVPVIRGGWGGVIISLQHKIKPLCNVIAILEVAAPPPSPP